MCSPVVHRRADPRRQRDAGLGLAIAWFTAAGWTVSVPLTDSQPYDLVVDDNGVLQRVWFARASRATVRLRRLESNHLSRMQSVSG